MFANRETVRESVIGALLTCVPGSRVPRSTASRVADGVMRTVDGYVTSERAQIEQQIEGHVARRVRADRDELVTRVELLVRFPDPDASQYAKGVADGHAAALLEVRTLLQGGGS